jgi:dienelactone hydrolase
MTKTATRPLPVTIAAHDVHLSGDLRLPPQARGLVLFAHGSGSSRFSPRNRYVAEVLDQRGLGTLLIDLLTRAEEEVDEATAELRFDITFLARRLEAVTDWLKGRPETGRLALGYFGASTGAAAALLAAAARPEDVFAVVSRGGRPDLALEALPWVQAPTLLKMGMVTK